MRYIFILLALLCASCGTALPSIKPYKLDIQQGNVVTSKMLLQLRPGMTKSQVRFIMGTPLVQDSFHSNRWDYVYQMRESGKIKEQRRVILDFENELLKSVRGDVVAAGSEQTKDGEAATPSGTRVVTPIKAQEEKGLLDKLKFWQGDDEAAAKEAATKAEKAKQEAEQTTKAVVPAQAAAEPQPNQAPVSNEPASILAVPIDLSNEAPSAIAAPSVEAAPVVDVPQAVAPVTETPQPAVIAPEAVQAIVPMATNPVAPAEQVVTPALTDRVEAAVPAATEPPVNPYYYKSPAGMQFDRKIQIEDEEPQSLVEPSGARSGNKVAPKPKQLPQEEDPSFFDRMLEQIGF